MNKLCVIVTCLVGMVLNSIGQYQQYKAPPVRYMSLSDAMVMQGAERAMRQRALQDRRATEAYLARRRAEDRRQQESHWLVKTSNGKNQTDFVASVELPSSQYADLPDIRDVLRSVKERENQELITAEELASQIAEKGTLLNILATTIQTKIDLAAFKASIGDLAGARAEIKWVDDWLKANEDGLHGLMTLTTTSKSERVRAVAQMIFDHLSGRYKNRDVEISVREPVSKAVIRQSLPLSVLIDPKTEAYFKQINLLPFNGGVPAVAPAQTNAPLMNKTSGKANGTGQTK